MIYANTREYRRKAEQLQGLRDYIHARIKAGRKSDQGDFEMEEQVRQLDIALRLAQNRTWKGWENHESRRT